jgi:acylphosphatase
MGVSGWVRNVSDGRVELEAEGSQELLEKFLSWVKQGPPSARVDDIEVQYIEVSGDTGFEILRS